MATKYLYVFEALGNPVSQDAEFNDRLHNVKLVERILGVCKEESVDAVRLPFEDDEMSPAVRFKKLHTLEEQRPCVYMGIGTNTSLFPGRDMYQRGITIGSLRDNMKSNLLAACLGLELETSFMESVKWYPEAVFQPKIPFLVLKAGFRSHPNDLLRMQTDWWKGNLVTAIMKTIMQLEKF